jgi:hypothetical protein
MPFNVLTIRSGLNTGDDALYPMLSDASCHELIALDDYDGPNGQRLVATAVQVLQIHDGGLKTLVRLRDVSIDVYITDGRIAVACEKYDKGGGWSGFGGVGLMVAVTANAVSKARAASRSRGKALVGHIRYPWLKSVGASVKTGVGTSEAIRLEYAEKLAGGTTVRKMLELTLPKNIDATMVAREITRRAAAYRLGHYPNMAAEAREKFASLNQAPPRLAPAAKKFAFVQLPTYYFAAAKTAYPPRPQADAPKPDETPGQAVNFCDQCGVGIVAGDSFCHACGAPVQAIPSPSLPAESRTS